MKTKELSAILLSIGLLSSCGPVADINSVDRAKVQQDVAKMAALEGTYSGAITSKKSGETIGFASLHLTPDSVIYNSPSDPRSQLRSVLRATLDVRLPEKKLAITFNESYFDAETKDIIVGYTTNTSTPGFKLKGQHRDNTIAGEILASGFPQEGLRFEFTLNGPEAETNSTLQSAAEAETVHAEKKYFVKGKSSGGEPLLILTAHSATSEEEFTRILVPYQWVNVSYNMGSGYYALFTNARWDIRSGRLTGETRVQVNNIQTVVGNIDCTSTGDTTGRLSLPDSLDCTVRTNNRGLLGRFDLVSP